VSAALPPPGSPQELPQGLPRTAVIGAGGFLGKAFLAAYRRAHPGAVGTARAAEAGAAGLVPFDLATDDARALRLAAGGHREALILAAVPSIVQCERDPAGTRAVNVDGTLRLAEALLADGVLPVFFSSDYVFDGARGGYRESDPTAPGTEYGRQKAEVEARLLALAGGACRILRLSKVFAVERGGGTLLDQIAARLVSGAGFDAAGDAIFCPTLREDVVAAVALAQGRDVRGVLHVCGPEARSWHDLAAALAAALGVDPALVRRRGIDELQPAPRRPKNVSMRNDRLVAATGCAFTPVAASVARVAALWRGPGR
jgi:dTDP-4-dehydrorhamnose reductase